MKDQQLQFLILGIVAICTIAYYWWTTIMDFCSFWFNRFESEHPLLYLIFIATFLLAFGLRTSTTNNNTNE